MSGNDNNTELTFRAALAAFGVRTGDLAYDFFKSRNLLDHTRQSWTAPNVYNHLHVIYKKSLIGLHSDKGGSGCVETFMMVMDAWRMFKVCHVRPIFIDLTLDSDIDDDHDDAHSIDSRNDDTKYDKSDEEDEHKQEDGQDTVLIGSDHITTEQVSLCEQTTEGMPAGGTVQHLNEKKYSPFEKMIGRSVEKIYWFKGEIDKIEDVEVEGKLLRLHHVKYDDNDGEDLTFDEFCELTMDDDCDIAKGNIGYTFWKGFLLTGKVTKIHYAENAKGGKDYFVFVLGTPRHHSLTLLTMVTLSYPPSFC